MGIKFVGILSLLGILLSEGCLQAENLREARFMERAKEGFADIFNLDYDHAGQVFESLQKEYPRHPAPPLYLACIVWLEEMLRRQDLSLDRFIAAGYFSRKTSQTMPPEKRAAFFEDLARCQARVRAILQKDRRDQDGRYFMAMSYGLQASFAVTIDHSPREAFSSGSRAYGYCKQLIEEDPNFYDAYLTTGIYEYIAGSIPWYMKWLTFFIGIRGSKEEGMEHLELASDKGPYVRNEAELALMVLQVRERRYAEALERARYLSGRFPRNFIFALNVAQVLQLVGRVDQSASLFAEVTKRAEAGEPNFDRLPLETFRCTLGAELVRMGKLDLAQEQFRKSIGNPRTPARESALSHLHLAEILDWKGQRSEAVRECQTVLALPDVEDSHLEARRILEKLQGRQGPGI